MTDAEMISCTDKSLQWERVVAIMHRLRAPGGCPWDAEQTHASLIPNVLEEGYELIDTIQREDWQHMKEELGDLLLQVLFHAEIAEEHAGFDIDDVARGLSEKLIRRHPHIFKQHHDMLAEEVLSQWDQIKRQEKGAEKAPYLANTGKGLPALLRAVKLQKKAAKVGFDWPDCQGNIDKIAEELEECREVLALPNESPEVEEELGDLLYAVVNLCRKRQVNPELALSKANAKFEARFGAMECLLAAAKNPLGCASLEEMEAFWQQAKLKEDKR